MQYCRQSVFTDKFTSKLSIKQSDTFKPLQVTFNPIHFVPSYVVNLFDMVVILLLNVSINYSQNLLASVY